MSCRGPCCRFAAAWTPTLGHDTSVISDALVTTNGDIEAAELSHRYVFSNLHSRGHLVLTAHPMSPGT